MSPNIDNREIKRRKRERLILIGTLVLIIILSVLMAHPNRQNEALSFSGNVLIFSLINVNIILIVFLLFLIIRNVTKLIFERRQGIIGSKLQTKLVVAFVSLSLIPTVLLFIVSVNFLSYSIDYWFNMKIGEALGKTIEVAQVYYQQTADHARYYARQLSSDITNNRLYVEGRETYLQNLIEQRQKIHNLGSLEIYFNNKKDVFVLKDPSHPRLTLRHLSPKIEEEVYGGRETSTVQPSEGSDLITGLAPIYSYLVPREVIGMVAVSYYVPPEIANNIDLISKTSERYRQLDLFKTPTKLSFIITLFIVLLLIIFAATWFGIYLAKGITVPIHDLAEATRRIARGELDHQINVVADAEIGILVDSFNQMTKDLQQSNSELNLANMNLEERRKYMETVLRNVSAGVISLDKDGVITTINQAAEKMFGIKTEFVLNKPYKEVLQPEHLSLVHEFTKEIRNNNSGYLVKQIDLTLKDKTLTILLTITVIKDDEDREVGMVLVFEDLTELQKAVRTAAWREVAKRMAHEIKNPLTPVQLSAQRLQKKYSEKLGEDGEVFQECTQTIINQVEVLKNLVNEFSRYARMPVTNFNLNNLNDVLMEAIALFQEAHKDIHLKFQSDEDLPKLKMDAEQIKRVMVNLISNAIAAVAGKEGVIEISVSHDRHYRKARVEIADNGCGVPAEYKMKMFEPYFSTKKTGTGLGLAIVGSIIAEHYGYISVRDNYPDGTVVSFELPIPEETQINGTVYETPAA